MIGRNSLDWQEHARQILVAIDIKREYLDLGLRITSGEPNSKGWLACRAMSREDRTPSAAINVGNGPMRGRYKDHATGESLGFFDFCAKYGRLGTWLDARKHYATKTGVNLAPNEKRPEDHFKILRWQDTFARLWTKHKPPITIDAMKLAGAVYGRWPVNAPDFASQSVFLLPCFPKGDAAQSPCGWIMVNSDGSNLKLYQGPGKPYNVKKVAAVSGSKSGLLNAHALKSIAAADIVWKVEGITDMLALQSVIPQKDINRHVVITNAFGCSEKPKPEWLRLFRDKTVYVVGDADTPGQAGAELWTTFLLGAAKSVKNVVLPFEIKDNHGEDIRDFLAGGGTHRRLFEMASKAPQIKPPVSAVAQPSATGKQSPAAGTLSPLGGEKIDDPHRLARDYVAAHAKHLDRATLVFYRQQFSMWCGDRWIERADSEFRGEITCFCKRNLAANFAAKDAEDDTSCMPKVTTGLVSNVIQAMTGEVLLSQDLPQPCWLGDGKKQRNYLACHNGLLDLDSFLASAENPLVAHTPLWFSPVCMPFDFQPDAKCPRWLAFLDRNLEGQDSAKAMLLQQFAGYLLTPDTTLQRFLLLLGEGANGKSVICAVLAALLGEGNVSAVPLELFGDKFRLAGTLGKLANIVAEVGELDRIAEGQLKAFVSGDPMEFERKFKAAFTARPTARLVLATNNPPAFSDKSDGLWRRMLLLRCNVQIPEQERITGMDKAQWWVDADELPGILCWALEGLFALRQAGRFKVPAECQADIDRLRVDANPARRFLEEHYQAGAGEVGTADVYRAYSDWSQRHGHHPLAEVGFGREVTRRFPTVTRGKQATARGRMNCYKGLEMRHD